jgi:hypothetical protein
MSDLTVTVWVMPHDDSDVEWVVNTLSDMEENFSDFLAACQDSETGAIAIRLPDADRTEVFYEPAELLKNADPVTYRSYFSNYCDGWTEMEMPWDVYFSEDDNAQREWLRTHFESEE